MRLSAGKRLGRLQLLKIAFSCSVQVLLAALVAQHLVQGLTQEGFSEATYLVLRISAVDNFEEVALLQ